MKIEMCDQFYYRVQDEDIYNIFNTSKENILRNNKNIKFYHGEWIKIKLNNFQTHIVKPMETIKLIAKQYNIDEQELQSWNNLKTEKLFIGQILKIHIKKPTE